MSVVSSATSEQQQHQRPVPTHLLPEHSIDTQWEHYHKLQRGTFAQISLDPVASLKSLCDPAVNKITPTIPRHRYWVYVVTARSTTIETVPLFSLQFMFVTKGPPKHCPLEGIDESLCIPILPCTNHPEGRPPADPAPPFPHDDFYIQTHTRYVVRIGYVHGEGEDARTVPKSTADRIERTQGLDWGRRGRAMRARAAEVYDTPDNSTHGSRKQEDDEKSIPEVNWDHEMLAVREKISSATNNFWNSRPAHVRELADKWLMPINPKDCGGPRTFQSVYDVYLNPADWTDASDIQEFQKSGKRMRGIAKESDRRWIKRIRKVLDMPPYVEPVPIDDDQQADVDDTSDPGIDGWLAGVQTAADQLPPDVVSRPIELMCVGCGTAVVCPRCEDSTREIATQKEMLLVMAEKISELENDNNKANTSKSKIPRLTRMLSRSVHRWASRCIDPQKSFS